MPHARRNLRLLCGDFYVDGGEGVDDSIAQLASRQHGVVARRQLNALGIGRTSIDHRARSGTLRRLHRGVFAVGHDALTFEARALAALLSLPPNAAVSHLTSLALWGLVAPLQGPIHVTADQPRTRRPGVVIHRSSLPPDEVGVIRGIPLTTLPRAFLDLSATLPRPRLRRLIKDAEFNRLVRVSELGEILQRYPRRRGRGKLARIVVPLLATGGLTRSGLEDEFLDFCAARGLPLPETNVRLTLGGRRIEADVMWRDARLIVELDGRDAHARELAFEDDRARDRAAIAAGWVPMRITSAQLRHEPDALESDIRGSLAHMRARA